MRLNKLKHTIIILFLLTFSVVAFGQKTTLVRGTVIDKSTQEPLGFVDIGFVGTTIGTSTDVDGKFQLEIEENVDSVFVMFLGYQTQYFGVVRGENHIDVVLIEDGLLLEAVEIKAKRGKYNKKNNPAIDLAEMVRTHKYINSLKGKDYYSYRQHEKIKLSFNNISDGIKNFKLVKNVDFIFDYMEESKLTGKTFLPFFLRETISEIYYKQDGDKFREKRIGSKITQIEQGPNPQTINHVLDAVYHDIDVYEDKINLFGRQFVSPFAKAGKNFYRYYIVDTTIVKDKEVINLEFIPAIKGNLGFIGNIFITNDSSYTVIKLDMKVLHDINLNFINDVSIVQEFEPYGEAYIKVMDRTEVDYSLRSDDLGVLGTRTVYYSDFKFDKLSDEHFSGIDKVIYTENADAKSDSFWVQNRIEALDIEEQRIEGMIDSLNNNKYIKTYKYIGNAINTGFAPIGKFSFGSMATFLTFNEVEGVNLRLGGETNFSMSKRIKLNGYLAYPFKTKKWKYVGGLTYTFNKDFERNPKHYFRIIAERESSFLGKELEFFKPESIFVSLQRGDASRMLFTNTYTAEYLHEMKGFSYNLALRNRKVEAYGDWSFLSHNELGETVKHENIIVSEISAGIRYAPNEKYIQGKKERLQLFNEYPILNVDFTQGFDNVLGSDYSYTKIKMELFKMFKWTVLGNTNLSLEAGKSWGEIPYLLQFIPRGNQTYTFHLEAYNMMNFMEFATDQYASFYLEHFFQGYFLNRIPLVKKLKWREVISFKTIFGSLSDINNPYLNASSIQFPINENGQGLTNILGQEPYMEASIGFTNIFKLLRVVIIKRINYLDNVNVPSMFNVKGLGIRFTVHTEF